MAAPTQVKIYQAYSADNVLNSDVVIAQHYTGPCWAGSVANPGRSDAWRCMTSSLILDPCFQDGSNILACIISPWSHKASLIEATTPMPQKMTITVKTKSPPWALELENGQVCTLLTGTTIVMGNARIKYTCANERYSVIGDVDKSTSPWTAKVYDFTNKTARITSVSTAWY
jgi:hypothetical protein